MKFSDIFIETKTVREQRIFGENIKFIEYEERKIIKELIPKESHMYYVWGNIAYAMIFDIKCNTNPNLIKIKDMCFQIEKSIKRGDIDIVILEIKNVLLPLLDKLTKDEIEILKKANRLSAGPIYEYYPQLSTPQIFIELFNNY